MRYNEDDFGLKSLYQKIQLEIYIKIRVKKCTFNGKCRNLNSDKNIISFCYLSTYAVYVCAIRLSIDEIEKQRKQVVLGEKKPPRKIKTERKSVERINK